MPLMAILMAYLYSISINMKDAVVSSDATLCVSSHYEITTTYKTIFSFFGQLQVPSPTDIN